MEPNTVHQVAISGFGIFFIAGLTFGFVGLALHYVQDILKYFGLR